MQAAIESVADKIIQTKDITMPYRIRMPDGRYFKGVGNFQRGNYRITSEKETAATMSFCKAMRIAASCGGKVEIVE